MKRSLLTLAAAVTFTAASSFAFAAGPNDGPKYPNMESHKQYKDQRILDHTNAAPRYAVTATNKQYKDQRILDHNNAHPAMRSPARPAPRGTRALSASLAMWCTPGMALPEATAKAPTASNNAMRPLPTPGEVRPR